MYDWHYISRVNNRRTRSGGLYIHMMEHGCIMKLLFATLLFSLLLGCADSSLPLDQNDPIANADSTIDSIQDSVQNATADTLVYSESPYGQDTISILAYSPLIGDTIYFDDTIQFKFSGDVVTPLDEHGDSSFSGMSGALEVCFNIASSFSTQYLPATSLWDHTKHTVKLYFPSMDLFEMPVIGEVFDMGVVIRPELLHGVNSEFVYVPDLNSYGIYPIIYIYGGLHRPIR